MNRSARRPAIRIAVLSLAVLCAGLSQAGENYRRPPSLPELVRQGTARFRNINVAFAEGYAAATTCVSGPEAGAMGVHLVHIDNGAPDKVADGVLNPTEPEALIYEPQSDGSYRLVGVEFLQIFQDWSDRKKKGPPSVSGQLMNLVGFPNRYGLPSFYELHVWAWENNPKGAFADWNNQVTCEHQRTVD